MEEVKLDEFLHRIGLEQGHICKLLEEEIDSFQILFHLKENDWNALQLQLPAIPLVMQLFGKQFKKEKKIVLPINASPLLQAFQVIEMDEYFESFWNAGIRHEYVLSMICVSEHATQVLEQVIGIQDEAKRRDCIKYFARKKYPSGLIDIAPQALRLRQILSEARTMYDQLYNLITQQLPLHVTDGTGILCTAQQFFAGKIGKREGIRILVVGLLKTGKSSLINFLLGEDVCAEDAERCTVYRTVIKYGAKRMIQMDNDTPIEVTGPKDAKFKELIAVPKEKRHDALLVRKVLTIYWPSPLLQAGIELIDSPGLSEDEILDSSTEELLDHVDLVIYLYRIINDVRAKDVNIIAKIYERREDVEIVVVGSNFDLAKKDPKLQKEEQIDQMLNEHFNTFSKACPKLGIKRQDNDHFHAISLRLLDEYQPGREQFLCKIKSVLTDAVQPMMKRISALLLNETHSLLSLFMYDSKSEQDALAKVTSKYQEALQLMQQASMQFVDVQVREYIENIYKKEKTDIMDDLLNQQYFENVAQTTDEIKRQIPLLFSMRLKARIDGGKKLLQTKMDEICKKIFDDSDQQHLFNATNELFHVVSDNAQNLFAWQFIDIFKFFGTTVYNAIVEILYAKEKAENTVARCWKEFAPLNILPAMQGQISQYYFAQADFFGTQCKQKDEIIKQRAKNQVELKTNFHHVMSKALTVWVSCRALQDDAESTHVQYNSNNNADVLGRGGVATVYKGTYKGQIVAVKEVYLDKVPEAYCLWEAFVFSMMSHANILKMLTCAKMEKKFILALEYMNYGSVRTFCSKNAGNISNQKKFDIMLQMARGLAYMHSKDTFHRDIKPSNALINDMGQVKLSDFNTAKLQPASEGTVLWTTGHASPEMIATQGNDVDLKTDIYSLGVSFWEIWMENVDHTARNPPNCALMQGAPKTLMKLINMCMQFKPQDRPTAAQVVFELEGMLQQL